MATDEDTSGGTDRVSMKEKLDYLTKKEKLDYLTKVFLYIGEQRLKTFNFYAIILAATVTMTGVAFKEGVPAVFRVAGGLHVVIAFVFFMIDKRNRVLLRKAREALCACEKEAFPNGKYHIISNDQADKSMKPLWLMRASYTTAFHTLYTAQVLFGIGIILWTFKGSPK